jgi:PhnB protein
MTGRPPVSPYLTIRNAAEAIDFYKRSFGAEETARHMTDDGKHVMHAALAINGGIVLLSDEMPGHADYPSPSSLGGTTSSVSLALDTPAEVDATHARAVANGATSLFDPHDPFWGGRFALVQDPFGHRWMFSSPHKS